LLWIFNHERCTTLNNLCQSATVLKIHFGCFLTEKCRKNSKNYCINDLHESSSAESYTPEASCTKLQFGIKVLQDNDEMFSESAYKTEPKNIVAQQTGNYEC